MRQRGDVAEKRQAIQCRKDSFINTSPPSRRSLIPVPEFFSGSWEDSYDGPMPATEQILNNGCLSHTGLPEVAGEESVGECRRFFSCKYNRNPKTFELLKFQTSPRLPGFIFFFAGEAARRNRL